MAYSTYITEAVVCGSMDHNTSDKSFMLFTKDAGMVYATARSVREERSKQRSALQEFSLIRVALIRGKAGWRIGSVEPEQNTFSTAPNRDVRAALVRMVKLIRQFVRGEESHPALYQDLRHALLAAARPEIDPENVAEIFTFRLLHKLGYVAETPGTAPWLQDDDTWTENVEALPTGVAQAIERALHESHL